DARNALRLENAIVSMVTIGVIGLLLDRVMLKLEQVGSLRWHFEQK
ncbi:MAG TPA: sulfonate ABC transporter permease, partial [Syntrophobacteraceae bacterium]|nr:sulfonate ABC transporter permease [Syntrophobacteraceae bacterium]